jgi:Tc toxin complex TcA C-terminal TcB-binding domain/Neuraminidase-like domain/Salmonella virulence plasmid 28.1kDa A protein
MHKITAPLKAGDGGPEVANLQDTFLALLERQVIQPLVAPNRPTLEELQKLAEVLKQERSQSLFGKATQQLLIYYQVQQGLGDNLRGMVEDKTATKLNEWLKSIGALDNPETAGFVVRGHVTGASADQFVRAYDRDFRTEELLGDSPIDLHGNYEIHYTSPQFKLAEIGTADLRVAVCEPGGRELESSGIHFNAGPETTIDLTVGPGPAVPSEYERYRADLERVLQGVALSDIDGEKEEDKERDLDFLAGDTGIDRRHIAWLVRAVKLAQEASVLTEAAPANVTRAPILVPQASRIPTEAFYGWLRQGLPTQLDALITTSDNTLKEALGTSQRDNIIPVLVPGALDAILERVHELNVARALKPSDQGALASFGDLLSVALPPDKHYAIASAYVRSVGNADALRRARETDNRMASIENAAGIQLFLRALENDESLTSDDVNLVKTTLALDDLAASHLPLVRELSRMMQKTPSSAGLSGFAQLDEGDWVKILQKPQDPGDPNSAPIGFPPGQESIDSYARTLNQFVESAFPTAVISNRIGRDNSDDSPFKEAKADLLVFFSNNPEFSFTATPPNLYLNADVSEKLRDVNNPDALRTQLKNMHRVFNVTPYFREIRALLADNLHSATAVVHIGERKFSERYAEPFGGRRKALDAYKKAEHVHATALTLFLKHAAASNTPLPYVISGVLRERPVAGSLLSVNRSLLTTPDYSTLFGSLDLCDCEHCQSLYSPAAYFVDILRFLDNCPQPTDTSPLQVLLERRPDIEHIELTCENTNTELPYVDLINEILEAAVVPRSFGIAEDAGISDVLTALANGELSSWMKTAFVNHGYPLSDKASLRVDTIAGHDIPSKWIVLDSGWGFTLKHMGTNEGFEVVAWPQTSWTSDELRANSEHTDSPAYAVLQGAVYPWNLPLNLPLEEVRAYLRNLGVQRNELMETLFLGMASDAMSDKGIALEYLGLAKEEADIITGATTGGPVGTPPPTGAWNFWGLLDTGNDMVDRTHGSAPHAQGDWDVVLQRVSIFLQQSGLSYKELLELLGTFFINPPASAGTPGGRLLGIVSVDPTDPTTCDLSQLEIQVIDDKSASSAKDDLIAAWNRIHRFVRLWRKLGWTMRDLDKAITSLKPGINDGQHNTTTIEAEKNDDFFVQLSHIQRLHTETNLHVVNLLAWWSDIDTGSYIDHMADGEPTVPSLYAQLFTNKTVSGQIVDENPAALSGSLSEKAAAIAAALQISVEDFTLLQAAIPNDDVLRLANLSLFYRHATFAKTLKLPIRSYLTTLELVSNTPFAAAANTIKFTKHINKIRESGFTVEDLDYLLRNKLSATSDVAPTDDEITTVLDAIRADMQKISADNTFVEAGLDDSAVTSDPNGDLTRKKLALLNWDPVLIEQIIAVLNNTFTYERGLPILAPSVIFPESLKGSLSYDSTKQKLRFTGTMTAADRALLVAPPNTDAAFMAAVGKLFEGPKDLVSRYMARFSVPVFSVTVTGTNLTLVLATLKFPDTLKKKIYYDTVAQTLRFVGVMTEAEHSVLSKLSPDNDYLTLIQTLFDAPDDSTNAPPDADVFLTSAGANNDASLLFDNPTDKPQVRFLLVLKNLLPYLRTTLSEIAVKQRVGDYLKVDATSIDGLLTKWVKPQVIDPADPKRRAIADFLDPAFAESSPNVKSSKEVFPRQFNSVVLLHKIAVFISKFTITSRQLQWLFESNPNVGWLDLNALSLGSAVAATLLFQGWERLADLFQLRDALPRGEDLLADIFTAATSRGAQLNKVLDILSEGTQWELGSLKTLSGANGFNFPLSAFEGEAAILRLSLAFALPKRLGASADQCLSWAKLPPTDDDARELKSLVRAKYDDTQWLELAKALRDPLRERQRSALVAYLVQKLGVGGADDLHNRFLIDVEMSPCMMTTRIKQAIGSVQLFIQRCLMNLEQNVFLTPKEAQQWSQWRKWYRVWEANRKVLFYPENWIEPELRDDKSPFYKDLENELLQSDVTMDSGENAFLHYLEKVDQVARLEIIGMYHQQETGEEAVDILHVFGRTRAVSHLYFYHRLEDGVWSAWEKVDLDIEGDHLIPVVWNRRLHLFWPVFTEKSEQATKDQRANNEDPNQYWEIKMSWSEYKNGAWSSRKVSTDWLRLNKYPYSPDDVPQTPPLDVPQDPQDFSFKTRIIQRADDEQLSIECYGTYPKEDPGPPASTDQPVTVITEFLKVLKPHEVFDFGQAKNVPQATFLKCRLQLGDDKITTTQSANTTVEIRDSSNNVLESVALNSNGVAYSMNGYNAQESLFLVSDKYEVDSVEEAGSWWMPFNPVAYTTFVVEFCFDAIADKTGVDVGQSAIDIAVAAAISTAIATAGNVAAILGAVGIAVSAAVSGNAAVSGVDIPKIAGQAAGRLFGRGMIVKLKEHVFPPPPPPPPPVFTTTIEIMQGIGQFTFDDCHGDLVAVPTDPRAPDTIPAALTPYPNTSIQYMQFVEAAGDHALVTPLPARGDAILDTTPGTFHLLAPHQDADFTFESPFFFQDGQCTYFVSVQESLSFAIHFHPYVCKFIKALNRNSVPGLLTLENQRLSDNGADFWQSYHPEPLYVPYGSQPTEDVDFDFRGAYSLYNWELFFHTPFLIAMRLSKNQRFEEAQKWFHFIFDPTATDSLDRPGNPGVERFWRVAPFYDEALRGIQTLEGLIADSSKLAEQVSVWEANPFKPHVIARIRVVAYMKAVVMRYIDNLIAWGDQLFRRDTIESINEATQLYILASEILGRRPESVPARAKAKVQTFRTLDDVEALDSLSNAMVEIESFLAPSLAPASAAGTQSAPPLTMEYFCITANDKLLGYWDTVSDRLFKIRHCMNIEGVERSLPIFEPQIDPGLLVRAAAAGVDITSVLNDINAALPHYRFNIMLQKATELCNDVKVLGAAFLSALEKQDTEQLALLRSTHEVELLKAIRVIKEQQTNEANNTLQGLIKYQDVVTARQQYYLSRPFLNTYEIGHLELVGETLIPMAAQAGAEVLAAILHLIPDAKLGFFTTVGTTYGGSNIASAIQASGSAAGTLASILNTQGSLSATLGGYQRRQEDWAHQADLATKELKQVEKQIAAAEIRLAISENELVNHDLQIENAKEVDEYMRYQKFTNQELYSWMVGELSGTYFQSYQLAYDVAKRAERAYRYELGLTDSNFIQFGYWDSLKKGLLSGERLDLDLRRMDVAYLDQNKREYEITKHISLTMIDPVCLIELKETGECLVSLPEALFDIDYPGQYMRRIKSVSITIPCVTGPYAGVNCTLTQLNSSMRHANTLSGGQYARRGDDTRFADSFGSIQSIVTSSGQNDSGLFEANMRDERFLPFEGQGAISAWRIRLQKQFKTFDYDTIADVVLHVRYTSRDGGELLKEQAITELTAAVNAVVQSAEQQGLARSFSLRHEFPNDWHRFLNPPADITGDQTLKMGFEKTRFPFLFQTKTISISGIKLFVKVKPAFAASYTKDTLKVSMQPGIGASPDTMLLNPWNGLLRGNRSSGGALGDWTLAAWQDTGNGVHKRIDAGAIEDILAVCAYTITGP